MYLHYTPCKTLKTWAVKSSSFRSIYKPYPNVEDYDSFKNVAHVLSCYLHLISRFGSDPDKDCNWGINHILPIAQGMSNEIQRSVYWLDKFLYPDLMYGGIPNINSQLRVSLSNYLVMLPNDCNGLLGSTWISWSYESSSDNLLWCSGNSNSIIISNEFKLHQLETLSNKSICVHEDILNTSNEEKINQSNVLITLLIIKLLIYLELRYTTRRTRRKKF